MFERHSVRVNPRTPVRVEIGLPGQSASLGVVSNISDGGACVVRQARARVTRNSMVRSFSARAIPRPRYSRSTPVYPLVAAFSARRLSRATPTGRSPSTASDRKDGSSTRLRMYLYPELLRRLPEEQRDVWTPIAEALCSPELELAFKRKFRRALEERFGKPVEKTFAPPRVGDIRDSWADVTRAREVLGWAPSVHLEDGLRRTIETLVG